MVFGNQKPFPVQDTDIFADAKESVIYQIVLVTKSRYELDMADHLSGLCISIIVSVNNKQKHPAHLCVCRNFPPWPYDGFLSEYILSNKTKILSRRR